MCSLHYWRECVGETYCVVIFYSFVKSLLKWQIQPSEWGWGRKQASIIEQTIDKALEVRRAKKGQSKSLVAFGGLWYPYQKFTESLQNVTSVMGENPIMQNLTWENDTLPIGVQFWYGNNPELIGFCFSGSQFSSLQAPQPIDKAELFIQNLDSVGVYCNTLKYWGQSRKFFYPHDCTILFLFSF